MYNLCLVAVNNYTIWTKQYYGKKKKIHHIKLRKIIKINPKNIEY